MSPQSNLNEFADEYGTTDDSREDVDLNPPDDGHIREVNKIHDYWRGLERIGDGYYNAQSLVPAGTLIVILDDSEEVVKRGWGHDKPIEPGVWLSGRDEISTMHPPTPVAVDDDYLRFAAEAMCEAAEAIIDDPDRIVALSTSRHETLNIALRDRKGVDPENLFDGGGIGGVPPEDGADLFKGYFNIRSFATPFNLYSRTDVPRLELEDLRTDALVGGDSA